MLKLPALRTALARLLLLVLHIPQPASADGPIRLAVVQVGDPDRNKPAPNIGIASALCKKLKLWCEVVPLPAARAFVELQANRVHFLMSLDHNPPGPVPMKIAKIESVPIVAIAHKPVRGCADLNIATAAAIRNVHYVEKLRRQCTGLKIVSVGTYAQAIQMYRNGRVDMVLGVGKNFVGKNSLVELSNTDFISQVDLENLWIFANETSRHSEAASRFRSNIAP